MLFRQLLDPDSCTYTYLLADELTRESLLIDPVKEWADRDLTLLNELNLNLIATINTHTHADHITASAKLAQLTHCQTIQGAEAQAQGVTRRIKDGETILFGQYSLLAIATPGHTPDSYCFYFEDNDDRRLFTGDTLLIRGTGRTDFQQGCAKQQYNSLFNKLLILPESTFVYPGHDYQGRTRSTIAEEKQHNPRLQVNNQAAYQQIMDSLNLPKPKHMEVAIPANLNCGATTED